MFNMIKLVLRISEDRKKLLNMWHKYGIRTTGKLSGKKLSGMHILTSYAKKNYILNTLKYKRGIHKNTTRK